MHLTIIENMICSKIHFRILKIQSYWINPATKVFELVDKYLGYTGRDLRGMDARRETNDARYVAMYCIKKLNPFISMIDLGKVFKRSRAASYYAFPIIKSLVKHDKQFQKKLKLVEKELFCLPCFYKINNLTLRQNILHL